MNRVEEGGHLRTMGTLISALIFFTLTTTSQVFCQRSRSNLTEWSKEDFPNPRVDLDKCGRGGKASWICDPENVLTEEEGNRSIQVNC